MRVAMFSIIGAQPTSAQKIVARSGVIMRLATRGGVAGSSAQGLMISTLLGTQRRRAGGTATRSLAQGSTSSSTTGGDHLPGAAGSSSGDGALWLWATGGGAAGRPEAGKARAGATAAAGGLTLPRHGSMMSPCWASATPPSNTVPNETWMIWKRPTKLSIAQRTD